MLPYLTDMPLSFTFHQKQDKPRRGRECARCKVALLFQEWLHYESAKAKGGGVVFAVALVLVARKVYLLNPSIFQLI